MEITGENILFQFMSFLISWGVDNMALLQSTQSLELDRNQFKPCPGLGKVNILNLVFLWSEDKIVYLIW